MSHVSAVRGDEPIFETEAVDSLLMLTLTGDPSSAGYRSRQFEYNRLRRQISDQDVQFLVFDFHQCGFLDSVTVGILVSLTLAVRQSGGEAVLCGLRDDVCRLLLRLIRIEPQARWLVWNRYPNRRHAVQSLVADRN